MQDNWCVYCSRCLVQVLVNSDRQNTWPLLCLNFVGQCLLAACLAGGLGKLTHTLSAPLQMKWKCMAGPEGLELSYGGVAKSVMLGLTNIPTLACACLISDCSSMQLFEIGVYANM